MAEAGPVQFPGNYLDPSAQEFWPAQNAVFQPQIPLLMPSELYYPYAAAPPLTVSFSGGGVAQFHVGVPVPLPAPCVTGSVTVSPLPPLPPPSAASARALVLTSVPCDVSESRVREELEAFGEVRMVQMERVGEGIMTVHFYDLRHAERALREIRNQHIQRQKQQAMAGSAGHEPGESDACTPLPPPERGRILGGTVWAHFIIPASNASPDGNNQGTVVVFNLHPGVSNSELRDIFQAYGPVKELRETPLKKHQKFVEFYDVRDAAKALREMNGKEVNGKQVVIEFSRPGGYSRKFFNANSAGSITPIKAYTHNISLKPSKYTHPPLSAPPIAPRFSNRYSPNIPRSFLSRSQSPSKKVTDSSKGNPNDNYKNMSSAGMTVIGGGAAAKKTAKKSQNNQSTQRISNGAKQQCRGRPWKDKQERKFDPRFLISEEAMAESNCQDSRTTVMIKNIPNKYSQNLLLNMLDNHCIHCNEQIVNAGDDQPLSSYDFVYLPIDFNNKCNVGYGFVNMTSPQATWRIYKAFHHQHWEVFNSRKICEVTYARVQGLQTLKEHFRYSKFPCDMDHYLPVVFSPPRDGKLLTEPVPVVGEKQQPRLINDGPSPAPDDEQSDSVDETSSEGNPPEGCGGRENNNASITPLFGDVGSDTLN
ncbi:Terminal EAR1-like 1, putative isoform 2 [Hibiscus syriacus]|uniref:Terminal EAR1-like 1, putative isoform 2 n=1 Tax=Hibiscus syriacus TaxID=106335 RepID=A0A6A3BL73_HIBSY|nr:Terminal EAR1-like 1, putative isoform 2 [Hibiscus syriacus]